MIIAFALLSVVAFMVALQLSGVIAVATQAAKTAAESGRALQRKDLSDDDKERLARDGSLKLFAAFAQILVRGALALLAGYLPLALANWLGLASMDATMGFLMRWDVIAILFVVITLGWILWRKRSA